MTIKELKELLNKQIDIDIEDYNGNTVARLSDLDLADVELDGGKEIIRLQININNPDYDILTKERNI